MAVRYTELKTGVSKVVLMEPKAFAFLMKVQKERDDRALAKMVTGEEVVEHEQDHGEQKEKTPEEKRKESLKKILDLSRIDMQEAPEELLGGQVNILLLYLLNCCHRMVCWTCALAWQTPPDSCTPGLPSLPGWTSCWPGGSS